MFIAMSLANTAHACSRAFAIDLEFAADSATLGRSEILKLVSWLDKWRREFPQFESVRVDGIAPETADGAKALARRRALETERALRTLLNKESIHVASHLSPPSSTFKGGNYAAIDLVPLQVDLPYCRPVPIAFEGAAASPSPVKYHPSPEEVVAASAHRSGLAEDALRGLLSNCDASQSAMNICAYRDAVEADLILQHAIANKVEQVPACKDRLEARIARWAAERDRGCKRSAAKAYGGGSLEPMVMSMCVQHENERMAKKIEHQRSCDR
ncbi:lysozyme inhibitor LprI family protein [Variovorax guangxiensis]|uniref:lysozyme inhibitor LprI family protein n=1 Tax=Variovorax guangxiensis TaxID=1775474 RepID=UPI001F0C99EC|nr:lysozyme inhibitor LprI family protein [Variovorax guangxiensis]